MKQIIEEYKQIQHNNPYYNIKKQLEKGYNVVSMVKIESTLLVIYELKLD